MTIWVRPSAKEKYNAYVTQPIKGYEVHYLPKDMVKIEGQHVMSKSEGAAFLGVDKLVG